MVAPRKPPLAPLLPTAARPPPAPPNRQQSARHLPQYGSVTKPAQASELPPRPPPAQPKKSECSKQPPVGPLSRVPSQPSLVPSFVVDLDQVAASVPRAAGTAITAEKLIESLNPTRDYVTNGASSYPPRTQSRLIHGDDLWESKKLLNPDPDIYDRPLRVVHAQEDAGKFSEESLVFKIREPKQSEEGTGLESTGVGIEGAEETDGFAFAVPVTADPDPFGNDGPSSWEQDPILPFAEKERDEENPLILGEPRLNMSYRNSAAAHVDAYVQRKGARHVAEEQEVLLAVNAEKVASRHTGLLIPVVDSKDDLRQVMFVHPPREEGNEEDEDTPLVDEESEPATTAEATREIVDNIAKRLPAMIDVESSLEVHGTAERASVAVTVTQQVSWVGYIILAIALIAVASQGTAVKWLPQVDGLIAATWLMQTQSLFMLPFAIFQYFTMTPQEHKILLKPRTAMRILFASLSQVCWAAGFFISIDYTSLFHAWCYNNVHSVILVLYALAKKTVFRDPRAHVVPGEVSGARIALAGVAIMQIPALMDNDKQTITADIVAMAGALGAISFLHFCKKLRDEVPLFLMMTPIAILNAIFLSIGSVAINGTDFSISDGGALGWLSSDRILLGLYLGGVVGFLGSVCCIAALKFLPNVVVGSVQTMMPVAGTLVAVIAGVDELPDFWSTVGGFALLYGVLMIADATRQTETKIVINKHITEAGVIPSEKERTKE